MDFATDEEWNPITNQAVFSFDGRTYGASLDESGQLCLSFLIEGMDMTTFETITPFVYTLYLPVELKQDALYQADLTWEGEGAFVTIDTAAGESASQTLTGSLTTASGEPVDLSEIRSIQFYAGEKAYESKIEGLEAPEHHRGGQYLHLPGGPERGLRLLRRPVHYPCGGVYTYRLGNCGDHPPGHAHFLSLCRRCLCFPGGLHHHL